MRSSRLVFVCAFLTEICLGGLDLTNPSISSWLMKSIKSLPTNRITENLYLEMHVLTLIIILLVLCYASSYDASSSYSTAVVNTHGVMQGRAMHGLADFVRMRLKDTLSKLCFMFILIDLFEEVVETIPFFRKLAGRVGVHHSMLLLTVSQMLHYSEDLFKGLEEQKNHRDKIEKENYIKRVLDQKYVSAEEAAIAHDKAICAIYKTEYPLAAALNYPERILEYLAVEEMKPVKYSMKHKGVYKDTKENVWRVCDLMIGQPSRK